MELQDFITTTLSEIVGGVKGFQDDMAKQGVGQRFVHGGAQPNFDHSSAQMVRFDIALAESTQAGSKKGIGVFLAGVGVGGQTKGESTASSHTRVSFSVPVTLPEGASGQ